MHVAPCPQHFKGAVEGQKRLQDVLLVPEPEIVDDPTPRIIRRQKYIVDMHQHTCLQPWQHFQKQKLNVAADLQHVAAVNEENIVLLQLLKLGQVNVLDRRSDQARKPGKPF